METPKTVQIGNIMSGKLPKSFNSGKETSFDSSNLKDVPIKGISLFVALTGGMTKTQDLKTIRQHEFEVSVGDLVWATIRKQYKQQWWPAIVCDGFKLPKEALNGPTQQDDCLVRCFGNGNYVWCSVCEVKPFVGYFDRLPSQSKAKKFVDALDKAVVELGNRVRTEFSCSCFSNVKMEKYGNFGDLLVSRFEPVKFLDYIRDFARDVCVPNKIDHVVKKNCLFAFYRSLGHLEIPMDQLMLTFGSQTEIKPEEENPYFDDGFEKFEKPFETRECGIKDEESMMDVNEGDDLTKMYGPSKSQRVKKPRKKWSRKKKVMQTNVCSSEMLSQLLFVAQDCYYPFESKNFDSVEWFIFNFRKRAFNDFLNVASTQPYCTRNHVEPRAGLGPAGSGHLPKKRGRKRKHINLQAPPSSTIIQDCTRNHGEPRVGLGPAGSGHVPKKRGRKRKNISLLNENGTDENINQRLINEVGIPCADLSYSKVNQDNVKEVKGTAFLLKFSSDHPLPCIQDLNSVFSKYGKLIESETQVFTENLSGQVVFPDSCNVGGAFMDLQNDKPFGPVLVNYKIQHLSGAESMVQCKTPIKPKPNSTEIQIVERSITINEIRHPSMDNVQSETRVKSLVNTPLKLKPCQDLESLKKNLEMMNLMLEKHGGSLPLETRMKLESEVKGLMKKVSAMDGPSSC
ncbi:PWWP domain-containing protein 5-like [Bidens hawaiensis]|uniref:PWWP domain-containing protein 5-like n=1 Tax=Bidens hawaiensis TaxID=980011 RepID=UPI00404ABCD7